MPTIRDERPGDEAAVRAVVAAAFGAADEADLVDLLRARGEVVLALVAELDGAVVGHILFSPLPLAGPERTIEAVALAPLAGHARLAAMGVPAVVVLGHPDYYPRFGFRAALAENLVAPFSGPAFMAAELVPGTLAAAAGHRVRYASAFGVGAHR